jgi:hypothetical protein
MAYPTGLKFTVVSHEIGTQPIDTVSTTQNHEIGHTVRARETSVPLGEATYIYLKGATSTAKGDVVVWNAKTGATTRALDDTGVGPVGVAMGVCDASTKYGWYCIEGCCSASAGSVNADAICQIISTAAIDDTATAGDTITGMATATTDSASFAYVTLARPYLAQTLG